MHNASILLLIVFFTGLVSLNWIRGLNLRLSLWHWHHLLLAPRIASVGVVVIVPIIRPTTNHGIAIEFSSSATSRPDIALWTANLSASIHRPWWLGCGQRNGLGPRRLRHRLRLGHRRSEGALGPTSIVATSCIGHRGKGGLPVGWALDKSLVIIPVKWRLLRGLVPIQLGLIPVGLGLVPAELGSIVPTELRSIVPAELRSIVPAQTGITPV